jgi:hypothetical protein
MGSPSCVAARHLPGGYPCTKVLTYDSRGALKIRSIASAPLMMTGRIYRRYTVSVTAVLVCPTRRLICSIGMASVRRDFLVFVSPCQEVRYGEYVHPGQGGTRLARMHGRV